MPKLLLILLILQAASAPQQTKTRGEPPRAVVQQQRGTDSLPVAVKLLNSGQTPADAAERAKQLENEQRIADRAFQVAMVTAGIYFVTLLVLVFQSFQLKRATTLTQRSVEVAKTTARRQLKAYVGARFVGYTPQSKARTFAFEIQLKNYGQTPARDLAVLSMNYAVLPFPVTDPAAIAALDTPDPDPHQAQRTVLHPGAEMFNSSSRLLKRLTDDEMDAVNKPIPPDSPNHPPVLYCFGTYEYWDIFGMRHWQHFCGMYYGNLRKEPENKAALAPVYNDASAPAENEERSES